MNPISEQIQSTIPNKKFTMVEEIKSRHQEILRLSITGSSPKEISLEMGLSLTQVIQVVNSAFFKKEKAKLQKRILFRTLDLQERANRMASYALNTQFKIMLTTTNDKVKLDASELIWEKSKYSKKLQVKDQPVITIAQLILAAYSDQRVMNPELPDVAKAHKGTLDLSKLLPVIEV